MATPDVMSKSHDKLLFFFFFWGMISLERETLTYKNLPKATSQS